VIVKIYNVSAPETKEELLTKKKEPKEEQHTPMTFWTVLPSNFGTHAVHLQEGHGQCYLRLVRPTAVSDPPEPSME
jgi:hypothetical protein